MKASNFSGAAGTVQQLMHGHSWSWPCLISAGILLFAISQCILLKCLGNFSLVATGTRGGGGNKGAWTSFTVNTLTLVYYTPYRLLLFAKEE
jgi:hypothetical protein